MSDLRRFICVLALAGISTGFAQEPVRDPMRPNAAVSSTPGQAPPAPGIALTGVLVSPSRRIAVINGRFYRVGDRVNGNEIVRIEPGSIRIRRGSEEVLITLREERVLAGRKDGDQDQ